MGKFPSRLVAQTRGNANKPGQRGGRLRTAIEVPTFGCHGPDRLHGAGPLVLTPGALRLGVAAVNEALPAPTGVRKLAPAAALSWTRERWNHQARANAYPNLYQLCEDSRLAHALPTLPYLATEPLPAAGVNEPRTKSSAKLP
jgi:hypothetical protein